MLPGTISVVDVFFVPDVLEFSALATTGRNAVGVRYDKWALST